jgi:hypothetical protein
MSTNININKENVFSPLNQESKENTRNSSIIYSTLRIAMILLIGFGAPFQHCFQKSDKFRKHLEKYKKIYFCYRIYCRIITHLSPVINILIISLAFATTSKTFLDMWRPIILLVVNLSAVIAVDLMFCYKDSKRDLIQNLWANQIVNSEFESEFDPNYDTCNMILIKLFLKFVNKVRRRNASLKLLVIVMLFNPLSAHLMMVYSIFKKVSNKNFDKLGISFGIFNAHIIFSEMLYYVSICMILTNNIIALNNFVKKQTEEKDLSKDTLQEIIDRFVLSLF